MSLLILDLGGVLFNIDFERTRHAMEALPGYNGSAITFGVEQQSDVFVAYDRGDITTPEFRSSLRSAYGYTCSDQDLDRAWCAILNNGLFADALDRIKLFKARFHASRTVILSNISELHHQDSAQRCTSVFDAVDNVYLSYVMRLRKPDPQALLHVCHAEGYMPQNAILVDDSHANCQAASALGMTVLHWK